MEPDSMMGKMGRMQGDKTRPKPSMNASMALMALKSMCNISLKYKA
jgi:hypothetical protein